MNDSSLLESRQEKLNQFFESVGVLDFVNANKVVQWIKELESLKHEETPKEYPVIPQILISLIEDFDVSEEFFEVYNEVYELVPQKRLEGKFPAQKLEEKWDEKSELNLYNWEIPDTATLYNEAVDLMKKEQVEESMELWDRYFEEIYRHHLTNREIYRPLANKAMCHFVLGEETKGKYYLDAALELNKNYGYAQMLKNQLESGELDLVISQGKIYSLRRKMQRRKDFSDCVDLEELEESWSTEKILDELKTHGIITDETSFKRLVEKYNSTDKLSDEEFYPHFMETKYSEDFPWMATSVLADRWCPDKPFVNKLYCFLNDFCEEIYGESEEVVNKVYGKFKDKFYMYLNADDAFFKDWKNLCEYEDSSSNLRLILIHLHGLGVDTSLRTKMKRMSEVTGDSRFLILEVLNLVQEGKSPEKSVELYYHDTPYIIAPYCDLGVFYEITKNHEARERCLLKALEIIEKREKENVMTVENDEFNIYRAYQFVLEELSVFYHDTKNIVKQEEIDNKQKEIEQREDELSDYDEKPNLEEALADMKAQVEKKEMQEDFAYKYFRYLQKLGINFETTEKIGFAHVKMGGGKVGRNDPCPCGSGKKYKKCCIE